MARSKNATALFEVIHSAKKPPKSSPSADMPAPKWWAKDSKKLPPRPPRRPTRPASSRPGWPPLSGLLPPPRHRRRSIRSRNLIPPPPPGRGTNRRPSSRWRTFNPNRSPKLFTRPNPLPSRSNPWKPAAEPAVPEETPPLVAEMKTKFADRFKARAQAVEAAEATPSPRWKQRSSVTPDLAEPVRSKPVRTEKDDTVAVDRGAHEVRFRLSYGGLVALGMILAAVLTIAYLAGTRSSDGTTRVRPAAPRPNRSRPAPACCPPSPRSGRQFRPRPPGPT